jgi:outer membrane lipase/esterase
MQESKRYLSVFFSSAVALLILIALPLSAAAASFSTLYSFGDSLVDSGNTQIALLGAGQPDPTPAAVGYFDGRFSNGPALADSINSRLFGGNLTESLAGGTNYSFGGARARDTGGIIPAIGLQVGAYLTDVGGVADPDALYFFNAGGNDVRDILLDGLDAATVIGDAVGAIASQISTLAGSGAVNFLVAGVGNVGAIPEIIPFGPGAVAAGTAASAGLNGALLPALTGLTGAIPSVNIWYLDVFEIGTQILSDPTSFGFPAGLITQTSCVDDGANPGCANHAFFDNVHPASPFYGIVADEALYVLAGDPLMVPEPAAILLLGLSLGVVALRRQTR